MDAKVTARQVREWVDKVERRYRLCLATLSKMKKVERTEGLGEQIVRFQGVLAAGLFHLEEVYGHLCQEESRLITQKQRLNPQWFQERMRSLGNQRKALRHVAGVGKSIGDAFAWFFYHREQDLLLEHTKRPVPVMPKGIGGKGEVEFVRNERHIGGKMVLCHSITTILRLGDVSLLDLNKLRVSAIGELKSNEVEPGTLSVHGSFIGRVEDLPRIGTEKALRGEGLSLEVKARLEKQVKEISAAISRVHQPRARVAAGAKWTPRTYSSILDELVKGLKTGGASWRRVDGGLILLAYQLPQRSLYTRLAARECCVPEFPGLVEEATAMLLEGSPHNDISGGTLHYAPGSANPTMIPGMFPLFWSPVSADVAADIMLQKVLVMTVYNPAHLLKRLEERGFEVGDIGGEVGLIQKSGAAKARIRGLIHILRLVPECLLTEESVADLVCAFVEETRKQGMPLGTQVAVHFQPTLFPSASGDSSSQ